ncbi:DoxX family protein [Aquabacter spiritensis]|uniref:Putative oxidoreductase n=1 Tax=Aquabacter spiritensis TaxID=933073 RepID=A0A4V2UY43_9HYPH|nr:DoxX family protein [Aquabacter spiritensis]TCT05948.1 putative oxidoreductase [Aquabacter spiritensis]
MLFFDNLALLVGRILLAVLILPSGVRKLMDLAGTTAYMTRMGVPAPDAMAVAAGAAEILLPILLLLGLLPRLTAVLTGGFVLVATLTAHRFWEFSEPGPAAMQQIQFLKNLGLIGGTMFYFVAGAGAYAVGAGRRTRR